MGIIDIRPLGQHRPSVRLFQKGNGANSTCFRSSLRCLCKRSILLFVVLVLVVINFVVIVNLA